MLVQDLAEMLTTWPMLLRLKLGAIAMLKNVLSSKVLTIDEFCRQYEISRSTYFALQKIGLGPQTMKIGRTVRISVKAAKAWVSRMEAEEAADFNSDKGRRRLARMACDEDEEDDNDWDID